MIALTNPIALFNNWRVKGLVDWFEDLLKKYERQSPDKYARFQAIWLQKRFFNLPNMVSLLRAALTLPIALLLTIDNPWAKVLAIVICVFSWITDFIDGPFSEAAKCKTDAGAILDPMADKILAICLIITQNCIFQIILHQLIVCLIAGEIVFSLMRLWRLFKKIAPFGSNLTGQTKLYGQIGVSFILIFRLPWALYANAILFISLLLLYWNIFSGLRLIAKFHLAKTATQAVSPN